MGAVTTTPVNTMGIDIFDESIFKKAGSFLGGGSREETIAQSYFIDQCKTLTADKGSTFSETGFTHLFDLLVELGFTIKEMVLELPTIINSWHEATASEVLELLSIDQNELSDADQLSLAIKGLNNDSSLFFGESYDLEGAYHILYNRL